MSTEPIAGAQERIGTPYPLLGGRATRRLWGIAALVLLSVAVSFFLGRYPKPYLTPLRAILNDRLARSLVVNLRVPRILTAFLLGIVLSASGTVFQLVFRNPLVDSGFLGVSPGAAFGASLAIVLLGGRAATIQTCAALFALLGLLGSAFLAQRVRFGDWTLRLVLSGIAVSALYTSGTGVLKYLADPLRQLPDITFWMLGGLWAITWVDLLQILPVVIPSLILIYLMRWRLNLLSMRDETAFSLGAAPARERFILLLAAAASTAAMVSKTGQIGWVGLIMPHIARRLVGSDARRVVPGAMLLGSLFVLWCDDVARTVLSGEIPLGILTSFIGAAVFLTMLTRQRVGAQR
jgi:iron complex transport system permease protein